MINAQQVGAEDVANYNLIAKLRSDEGDSDRPIALAKVVQGLYRRYASEITGGGASSPHGFSASDHEALEANYVYFGRVRFNSLRGAILKAAGGRCPYCHQAKANEIDHFLPKAHFGQFSVFTQNLLPICTACNKKKSNRYANDTRGRRYFHPYFDTLPSEPFVRVNLTMGLALSIDFVVDPPATMLSATADRLSTQFDDLGLADRYADEALDEVMSRLLSIYIYFDVGGAPAVKKYLQIDAHSASASRGPNHWLSLTLDALAESAAFCSGGFKSLGPRPVL